VSASYYKDYYEVLGIDSNASQQEIKDTYRKLALQYHPDRNKDDPSATDKMKTINEAYATLSDPAKRREYDLLRERYGSTAHEQYRQAHPHPFAKSCSWWGVVFKRQN
jgi:DnaJ-class molecular chaperone